MTFETIIQLLGASGAGAIIVALFNYRSKKAETREKNVDTDIKIYKFIEEQRNIREKEIYELKEEVIKLKQVIGEKDLENKRLSSVIKRLEGTIKSLEAQADRLNNKLKELRNE